MALPKCRGDNGLLFFFNYRYSNKSHVNYPFRLIADNDKYKLNSYIPTVWYYYLMLYVNNHT